MLALTGGTGFVGQMVLDILKEWGCAVRALTRRPQARAFPGLEWVEGSLSDTSALGRLCDGADAVLHIAGLTSTLDLAKFEAVNVGGTQHMIEAAHARGIERFVFVSSLAAREPRLSVYGNSKAVAEDEVRASSLDWTIVRPPAVYGPRDTELRELFRAAKGGLVPVPKLGRASLIHVRDLARLLVDLAMSDKGIGDTYEPDDGKKGGYTHSEMVAAIADGMGRKARALPMPNALIKLAARADERFRKENAKLTRDRASYMLHADWVSRPAMKPPPKLWSPEITAQEGMAQTAAWYRKEGLL
ncbi:NAD-dependent epimerase/dehydratase family protein [Qipengyuania atrilutea]|uniref:NAD(P)H-binding protein n=1 Tax=Qipengyuania atrilutea TaxID=2744473 RepID=A0A850H7V2_9SPHN|nr:NAD(P)H-binding protein [Actirhodobacter atriluteus]NVD45873.1 NAD(P)H-binding protein [Actirhodobacter atriluteus]